MKEEGRKEPGQRPWRDAPSSGRRRQKAPARGGPVGAAERGGTEHARRPLSASGALRGVPAEGVGRDIDSAAGEGLPQLALRPEDQQPQAKQDDNSQNNRAVDPHGPRAAKVRAPAKTSGRLDHAAI